MKKQKYILLLFFLIGISIMSIGYSLLATNLTLNANSEIVGERDVRITNMKAIQVSRGCDAGTPMFTDTTITYDTSSTGIPETKSKAITGTIEYVQA